MYEGEGYYLKGEMTERIDSNHTGCRDHRDGELDNWRNGDIIKENS